MINNILSRAKALLMKPADTWDQIADEKIELAEIFKTWVMPLAAIGPIAGFIGMSVFGVGFAGFHYRVPFISGLVGAIVAFALSLIMVWGFAKIVELLAPGFGAKADFNQSLKLSAYFPVAAWLFAGLQVLPALSALGIIGGIWSLYLLFVGLPKMMKPAEDKAVIYTLASIGCAIVLAILLGIVSAALTPKPGLESLRAKDPSVLSMEQRSIDIGEAAERGDLGAILGALTGADPKATLVETEALQNMAPQKLAGFTRSDIEVQSLPFPVKMAQLTATYKKGSQSFKLEITHSPAIQSILSMSGIIGTSDSKTENGYKKISKKGGETFIEEWNKQSERGEYGRTHKEFMIMASGNGVPMKTLKAAVAGISNKKLDKLPRQK